MAVRDRAQRAPGGPTPGAGAAAGEPPAATTAGSPDPLLRDRVLAAIAALPPGQRDAVALFYLADLSHAEIAARLGTSAGAVKTRLHKARAALQARLADLRREPPAMPTTVPMRVADVRDAGDLHVVLLEERDGARRLPIWIGAPEATTLAARLHDVETPAARAPTASPPTCSPPPAPGSRRSASCGSPTRSSTPRRGSAGGAAVDARPSDALNLALVTGAPILVDEAVLAQAAEGEREIAEELERALGSERDSRAIAADERERIAALPYGPEDAPRA